MDSCFDAFAHRVGEIALARVMPLELAKGLAVNFAMDDFIEGY
jgi:hypothetical protein